ncbi:hypothetical protein SBP8a_41 [Bacillus phage SBP8a]|nr:hypothetical protein SBP8a_41 [Bacillus phage SBP8a]
MAKHSLTFYNNGVTLRKYGGTATDMYYMERDWWNTAHIMFPRIMEGELVLVRKYNGRKYVCGRFIVDKFGGITNASDNGKTETTGAEINITCG